MRFDDRLLTVLSQPVGDRHDAAVRWRQLVDLVARAGPQSASPALAQALQAIRTDAPNIDEDLRAAAARAVAGRPLPIGLLEFLVSDRLSVSAPVLAAATLDEAQWRALLPLADEETRQFIETVHPVSARAVPPAPVEVAVEEEQEPPAPQPEPQPATAGTIREAGPSLSEVVARIERRRRSRENQRRGSPAMIPEEAPSLFRWECSPGGEIVWVDGAPRGALIGRSIARSNGDGGIDEDALRAFARRAPFRDAELTVAGDGLVSGAWKISGLPAFDSTDGRFAGYRGIAQRDSTPPPPRENVTDMLADPDSLRELVHEVKTPLNAIIGFAEIIQGQYLGPADHRYRERAGEIVAQARLLLRAIDDLDFAAKIHSSASGSRRVDLTRLIDAARNSLGEMAAAHNVELEIVTRPGDCIAAVEPEIADRLLDRFAAAAMEAASAGEHLTISVEAAETDCRVAISRPAALRNLSDRLLFEGEGAGESLAPNVDSAGFSRRLVRGLARIAGGDFVTTPASLILVLPAA